jgi:hypothetical protein
MKRLILSAVAFFLACTCLPAQVPDWAVSHSHPRYPVDGYIIGIGSASGDNAGESARRLAQSDIATQVRVRVQSEIKNVQQTFELNKNEASYAEFRIKSTSVVDELLTGATIVETMTDAATNTVYALAVLNRLQFVGTIGAELNSGWNQANVLVKASDDFIRRGKLLESIQNLLDARKIVADMLPKQALHDAVSRIPYEAHQELGPSALTSRIRAALSFVRIEKKEGDNQLGKIGETFENPFIVHLALVLEDRTVPLTGTPVKFLTAKDELISELSTDQNGNVSLTTNIRGGKNTSIRAFLSLPSIEKEFWQNLNSSSIQFTYTALAPDIAFAVKAGTGSLKMTQALISSISSVITDIGYRTVDISRFIILAEYRPAPSMSVGGLTGAIVSVNADVTITLLDNQTSKTLGSISVKAKGAGKNEQEAGEKAVRDLRIPENDMLQLLQKAKGVE